MRSTEQIPPCPQCPLCARTPWLLMAGWFLVALFAGETELLAQIPGPAAPLSVLALTAVVLLILKISSGAREWTQRLALPALVGFHLIRFIGIYFLVLNHQGDLPSTFAVPAGWGDIIVAGTAALILSVPALRRSERVLLGWNLLGLADILMVVVNALRVVMVDRDAMAPFTRLPLSFLPTMIVPLIIVSHLIIFWRLRARSERSTASSEPEFPDGEPARIPH